MSRVEVKFESYLLLLLFSYDRNWPGYFMLLALGLILTQKKFGDGMHDILSRRHSLLRHSRAMFTRDVALPQKSGCPTFHSHSLSPTH